MKLISWNVNGLRAAMKKDFSEFFNAIDADIFCIQETKMQESQKEFHFDSYYEYWNDADKKGYSGTLIYTKYKPLRVMYGLPDGSYNDEGRMITLEFEEFYLVNTYVPNSKRELLRLPYRMEYEDQVRAFYMELDKLKPVILCGDLNVAHQEIDIKNPKQNERSAGFTIEERNQLSKLLENGFIDTFRYLHPDTIKYSWWSYMFNSRQRNTGWRLDYFIVSERLKSKIKQADILNEVHGSDHCPVLLEVEL